MKCIQCDTENNLKDRTEHEGRCKNCGHPFVFDPQAKEAMFSNLSYWARSRFTDVFFKNAINAISAENSLYFTPKQFFYALERRLKKSTCDSEVGVHIISLFLGGPTLFTILFFLYQILAEYTKIKLYMSYVGLFFTIELIIAITSMYYIMKSNSKMTIQSDCLDYARMGLFFGRLVLILGIIISLTLSSIPVAGFIVFMFSIALGLELMYLSQRQLSRIFYMPQPLVVKPSKVDRLVNRWTQVNEIPKMLPPPNDENASVAVSPDITAYSFNRVVVCDSNSIAQMLIANNFHFEKNCAVLSTTGYPQSIFDTVMQMLRRNPDLKVYALHDASPRGVSLVHRLGSSPNWFAHNSITIYDLGLLPRHVFASQNMLVRQSPEFAKTARQLPEPVRQSLSKDELEWLEMGNYVELEFFTPRRLLQVVSQGIARSQELGSANDMTSIYRDGDYDNTSTSAIIFASESFG